MDSGTHTFFYALFLLSFSSSNLTSDCFLLELARVSNHHLLGRGATGRSQGLNLFHNVHTFSDLSKDRVLAVNCKCLRNV